MNPKHINAHITCARIYSDIVQSNHTNSYWKGQYSIEERGQALEESVGFYEKAISSMLNEPVIICEEYLRFISLYGTPRQKLAAMKFANLIIPMLNQQQMKATGSSMTMNWDPCYLLIEEIKSSL